MAKRRSWSKRIEEAGVAVRIYERANSSSLLVFDRPGRPEEAAEPEDRGPGRRPRTEPGRLPGSSHASSSATIGSPGSALTIARLEELYLHHRGPMLSARRRQSMRTVLGLFRTHLGASFLVEDFGQHDLDGYVLARTSGRLRPNDPQRASEHPRSGTIRNEVHQLSTACNWAARHRRGGRPLLGFNPVRGLSMPREDNPSRPLATEARYRGLLTVADGADPEGRLRPLLVLAWETGRRINAILHLRACDVLLAVDQVKRALSEEGQDETVAEHWPQAIRWRAEWDKCGYLDFSPISSAARAALEAYLRRRAVVGEGSVFPANREASTPLSKCMAGHYLRKAEKAAGLPHQRQGGWHAFRRAWATRRKHLPVQDVMAAGGWRDVKALQSAYQAADPETVRRVVEGA